MKQADYDTVTSTIPAGEFRVFKGGDYFRVYEATGDLFVEFQTATGHKIADGTFEAGEFARQPSDLIKITNNNATSVTAKFRISTGESGTSKVELSSGTESDPLVITEKFEALVYALIMGHTVAAGNFSALFIPPQAGQALLLDRVKAWFLGAFDLAIASPTEATITAEGVWTSMTMSYAEAGVMTGYNFYTLTNTAPLVSAAADSANKIMVDIAPGDHPMPVKQYMPAGSTMGTLLRFDNVSGVSDTLTVVGQAEEKG